MVPIRAAALVAAIAVAVGCSPAPDHPPAPAASSAPGEPVLSGLGEPPASAVLSESGESAATAALPEPGNPAATAAPSEPGNPAATNASPEPGNPAATAAPPEPGNPAATNASSEPGNPAVTDAPPVAVADSGETAAPPAPADRSGLPDLDSGTGAARWTVEILERRPHDPAAFTQGLEMADGALYESTGLYGRSSLRLVDPATGAVTAETAVADDLFAEGLTVVGDRIVQLTWKAGRALVYDRSTLGLVGEFAYGGEGWGLCRSDGELVMSDGSDRLTRRDPESFELIGTVAVASAGIAVDRLNELECLDGLVIANVWQTPDLLVIDLADGRVAAVIDGRPLIDDVIAAAAEPGTIDVLNGVAALGDGTFLMTGKLWPLMYRVRVVEAD